MDISFVENEMTNSGTDVEASKKVKNLIGEIRQIPDPRTTREGTSNWT